MTTHYLDAALRPWQLRPIKPELLTGSPDDARVEDLVRSTKRDLCFSAFPMDRQDDVIFEMWRLPLPCSYPWLALAREVASVSDADRYLKVVSAGFSFRSP